MFVLDGPNGPLAIRQTAHALLAWQLATHWGNRLFLRPSPRAETLAAVLLHDSGWVDFDNDPEVDAEGRPITFDRMPVREHLAIWRRSIAIATAHSRFAGYLVAGHHLRLASWKVDNHPEARLPVDEFLEENQTLTERIRRELGADPRYAQALSTPQVQANAALLAACDRLAVAVCAGHRPPFELPAVTRDGAEVSVRVTAAGPGTWRLRPWPLQGRRLTVHVEAVRLPEGPPCRNELRATLANAPVTRLSTTLLPPGEPA